VVLFIFQKPPPVSSERFSKTKILCNGLQPTPPLEEKGGEIFVVQFKLEYQSSLGARISPPGEEPAPGIGKYRRQEGEVVDNFTFLMCNNQPPPVSSERFSKTKILCNGLQPTPPLEEKGGEIL